MMPEDVPEIAGIERASFSTPWAERSFYNEIYNSHSLTRVAELNGIIAGYICAKQIADECHLLDIAVHPDYRKLGIASMLLENAVGDLKANGCKNMYLEVRATNYAARKLYEKFGFKIVGTRKKYYLTPEENAVVMMLELDRPGAA